MVLNTGHQNRQLLEDRILEQRDSRKLALHSPLYIIVKAFVNEIPIIAAILGVAILIGKVEGWTLSQALYFGIVTASTVGYGDVTPKDDKMKAVAIVILPLMVAVFCELISRVAGAYLKVRH